MSILLASCDNIYMKLTRHIAITVPVVFAFYLITKSAIGAIGVFISGVLIDVDHFVDFWYDRGFNLNIKEFFKYSGSGSQSRYFILFHSYEVFTVFYILIQFKFFPYFFEGMAIGLALHLFLDYIALQYKGCGKWHSFILFSFMFRLFLGFKRFEIDKLCKNGCKCGIK